jgi:hypothetical protein
VPAAVRPAIVQPSTTKEAQMIDVVIWSDIV